MRRPFIRRAAIALAVVTALPLSAVAGPVEDLIGCDPIDPALCLLPFPNDHFTRPDPRTPTGKRVHISPLATPRALGGVKPVFTDEINRNDGFSPGSDLLTFVPGLNLHQTWSTTTDHITDLSRYSRADAPMLIINTQTGARHSFWAELDTHPMTPIDQRLLIMRPAVNFDEGTRYIVALRNLKNASGATIPAGAFAPYRDGTGADAERQADITRIIGELTTAEPALNTGELYLAWEFTVASWQSLAGRVLHMRNDAFARLGDFDLADGSVQGVAPRFRVDEVIPRTGDTRAFVHGTFLVPNYLIAHVATPDVVDPTGGMVSEDRVPPLYSPHTRLYYPLGSELPAVNPAQPFLEAKFTCRIPSSATPSNPARPILMGHGLLGERYEVGWNSGNLLTRDHNSMYCGTEWIGMAFGDIPQAVTILLDPSLMPSLADRSQQGFVNFMYLGRLMVHAQGLASDPAFQTGGQPLLGDNLVYDGNSQGGIMGGALAALAPDYTRATLGVLGMNYSTLLNRSVDWEGNGAPDEVPPAYATVFYTSIPDKREQQIMMALIQMLWDRAEANGYAHHMSDDPYPNTPAHQILLHAAYGDYQVANVSGEVEARTIGARLLGRSMPASRHWSVDPAFGLGVIAAGGSWNGSALVYWDSGNPVPPNGNVPPPDLGKDPHEHPRRDLESGWQRVHFFDTGAIADVATDYCTNEFASQTLIPVCPSA